VKHIFEEILSIYRSGKKAALCLITSTKGSTPRKAGAKMIVLEDGSVHGSIGGGNLEKQVIQDALDVIKQQKPGTFKHDLLHQHSMCCGGTVEIYIEPIMNVNKLYIFGAGHTGKALAKFASELDFQIVVIDDRDEFISSINIPDVNKLNLPHNLALPMLPFDDNTYIAILTYDHSIDRDILSFCINKPHAYLGMIGSQRKVNVTRKMFLEAGIGTLEDLEKVNMPIGIDINAHTPEEIAISILAEIIKVKNSVPVSNVI
jgi:xanthine dehydrogenase accessory factor